MRRGAAHSISLGARAFFDSATAHLLDQLYVHGASGRAATAHFTWASIERNDRDDLHARRLQHLPQSNVELSYQTESSKAIYESADF